MIEWLKRHWLIITLGLILLIFIFFTNQISSLLLPSASEIDIPTIEENPDENFTNLYVIVDVKGAVHKPGVYEVEEHARVHDVIELAGGFTKEADQLFINLAQKVQDEMTIIVPSVNGHEAAASHNASDSGKVRLNYATESEIETLNGIGPSKAKAILKYREEHGFFTKIEDLLEISGIGEKTLENIRDQIQVP
ncbi:helix-hairpin-helix domain-containing protein [Ornithinibacillus sp. 4-3]|uniref:Helix-hairpin-helix domain-containing protein n=1 Tax=Ornithinibacillus sp. 4-3 TaxID=3231488 RepID=A0AB39HL66_9BACI